MNLGLAISSSQNYRQAVARFIIALASALLPSGSRDLVRAEWSAESAWLKHRGDAALPFALRLLRSAPSTSIANRAGTSLAFAELSVALLFGVFSSGTFAVVAFVVSKPAMGLAYATTTVGTFLISLGLWREEAGFFRGRIARVGALLLAGGRGFLATVPIHIPTQSMLRARDDYALTVVAIGTLVVFVAQMPSIRNMVWTRAGLLIAGLGSLAGGLADIVNLVSLNETLAVDLSLTIAAVTAFGAGIATLIVVRRDVVFEPT